MYVKLCTLQQLLQLESHSYGKQVTLDMPTTNQSHVERLEGVPTLPLPLVNAKLTQVTFATKATPPLMGKSLSSGTNFLLSKPRASSFNVSTDNDLAVDKALSSQSTDDLNIKVLGSNFTDLSEHLKAVESQSHTSSANLIIGAQDYDPSKSDASIVEWEELEMQAASGCQGVPRENFSPATLVMNETTDNSRMPHCVVNGQC